SQLSIKKSRGVLSFPAFGWFLVYSLLLVFSVIINSTNPRDAISFYRITLLSYLVFIAFYNFQFTEKKVWNFYFFFKRVLILQIIASLLKLFLIGFAEKPVGTLSMQGGAITTIFSLMIVAILFSYYFFHKRDKKVLWWLLLFLIIPIVNIKRAIWFMAPLIILLSYIYYNHYYGKGVRSIMNKLIPVVLLMGIIFYFGVRLNRTLNPERKIWGSFDIEYVFNYAENYNYQDENEARTGLVHGRMAVFEYALFQSLTERELKNVFFGYGIEHFIGAGHRSDFFRSTLGVGSRGSMSGLVQTMWAAGILVAIALFAFYVQFLFKLRKMRKMSKSMHHHLFICISIMFTLIIIFDYMIYTSGFIGSLQLNIIYFAFVAISLKKTNENILNRV
ncbi:MAG: hypothetical protein ACOCWG_05935, partial [bacterium]